MKRPPSRDAAGFATGAKKHLGQNFLHERGVVEKIVLAIDPRPGDRIVDDALRGDFDIADPVIAVLGLNPHAGEEGHLGREEIDVIIPVIDRLRAEGMRLVGPLPADTAFLPSKLQGFDAVLAMYHDQGLPVLKYSGFESAVNLTLGLPYPRVAVDHGTALDIAGSGRADPSSLFAAIQACTRFAATRRARRERA